MKTNAIKFSISFFLLVILLFVFMICKGNEVFSDYDISTKNENQLEQILLNAHIPEYHYQVVNSYPHEARSFTEGLIWEHGGLVYESTGLYGQSKLRKIEIKSGKILQEYGLPSHYFAEGITIIGNQLYQLTYQEHTGFIYDKNSFHLKNQFTYVSEGWGLTTDNHQLIMSNGSSFLTFMDVKTLKTVRTLPVNINNYPVKSLNALQYINGMIYANVWPTSIIVIISAQTGKVEGWMNIKALKPASSCTECVANGIAFNDQDNLLLVTGKNWLYFYEIRVSMKK